MKILFITNIPNPYRNAFYNELGKKVELTVLYEAASAKNQGIRFNWNVEDIVNYNATFLSRGDITENKLDRSIFKYIKNTYDYIFVSNYAYVTEMAAIVYLKLHHIPFIMEIDGGIIKNEHWMKRLWKKFLISSADGYFSPSIETDKFLMHYGAKMNKIHRHIFTSLHEEQIDKKLLTKEEKNVVRKKLGISGKNIIVGVGQLIYRKGWDLLLSIAKEIDAEFYILGEGELKNQYKQLINKMQIENVHFVGFQNNDMTSEYYKAADVFVLPTREDIWGLVVNEAMAHGLPIVTTNKCNAGIELVQDGVNGFIVPVDDNVKLKNVIQMALNNKEKMGAASLIKISKYTIENMAKEHVDFMLRGKK